MMVNSVERYMVGLRCPIVGCTFDQVTPHTRPPLVAYTVRDVSPEPPDPDREAMRAHLATHSVSELASIVLDARDDWRTTYRLVREERTDPVR